jgi:hypothetical protein
MDAIVANAGSDYRYRARAPRAEVASAMAKIASDIHCANFKDDVAKEQGKVRAGFYGKVWEVLYSLPDQTAPAVGMPAATSAGGLTAAFGGVLVDDQGRFLLRGPTDTTVDTSGRLSMTTNAVGRKRDLAVLKSAVQFMQRQAG